MRVIYLWLWVSFDHQSVLFVKGLVEKDKKDEIMTIKGKP